MRHPSRKLAAIALAVILATTVSACGPHGAASMDPASSSLASASPGAGSATGTAGSGTAGATSSGSASGTKTLSPRDAKAIEQQLDAIERELDSLGMPSDSDFKDVEDSLK